METWRPFPDFEATHEVSNIGRVRSVDTTLTNRDGVRRRWKGRMLTPSPNVDGYLRVTLSGNTTVYVAQAVLRAFVGPRPPGQVVCHGDNRPSNNAAENLRWGTQSENIQQSVRDRTHTHARRSTCPKGHEYDGRNGTHRRCKRCHAENERTRREQLRLANR